MADPYPPQPGWYPGFGQPVRLFRPSLEVGSWEDGKDSHRGHFFMSTISLGPHFLDFHSHVKKRFNMF